MRHIISILMENEPGALSRVVGLFSQRNFNIETLNVAPTEDPSLSRLTVTTVGDDRVIEQITKHLNKLIDVVKLVDLTEGNHIERELMLVKVKALGRRSRRGQAHGGYLPRADRRRDAEPLHRADHRRCRQSWMPSCRPWRRWASWRWRGPGYRGSPGETRSSEL
jgi:acetolactate synthase small subunit